MKEFGNIYNGVSIKIMNQSKIACLFNHHNYSKRITKDKDNYSIHLCKICKRSGHYKTSYGFEYWFDYDDKGNTIHRYEQWKHKGK
jgi:hypothetical protein